MKIKTKEMIIYSFWMFSSFILMVPFSSRFSVIGLIKSISTGLAIGVFLIVSASLILIKYTKLEKLRKKINLPYELIAVINTGNGIKNILNR